MSGRAIWIVLGIAKPPLLISSSDGSTLFPSTSILTSDDVVQHAETVDQEMVLRPRDARRDAGIDQVRRAEQVDEPISGGEIDPGLQLGLSHVASGYCGDGHATVL